MPHTVDWRPSKFRLVLQFRLLVCSGASDSPSDSTGSDSVVRLDERIGYALR